MTTTWVKYIWEEIEEAKQSWVRIENIGIYFWVVFDHRCQIFYFWKVST